MENKEWIIGVLNKALIQNKMEAKVNYELKMKGVEIISLCMDKARTEAIKQIYVEGLKRVYKGEEDLGEYVEWIEEKIID